MATPEMLEPREDCIKCEKPVGQAHSQDCSVARCATCGSQYFQCSMVRDHKAQPSIVQPYWPGEKEAQDRNWFFEAGDSANWDINRVIVELVWDSKTQMYVDPA